MKIATISICLILLLSLVPCVEADIIHGCYKNKKGDLRIVGGPEDCKKKETYISWNSEGQQGPPGRTLYVVDGDDNEVGLLIDANDNSYTIFYETTGLILRIPPHTGIPFFTETTYLTFDSYDCTYDTTVFSPNHAFIRETIVYNSFLDKYFRVQEVLQTHVTHSELAPTYPDNCYVRDAVESTVAVLEVVNDIPTFLPPLHVERR